VLTYFLLGALIGAITGVPIGPVNVAIIDAAYRHHVKRAIAVGLGGALGDFAYAALGTVGLGPLLMSYETVPPILNGVSGVVLVVYGVLTVRAQPVDPGGGTAADHQAPYFWSGLGLGAALILLNPAALITWVVIVGARFAEGTTAEGWAAALGIATGSAAWFTFVAYAADHGKKVLGKKTLWLTRAVGVLLIGAGLFFLGRAGYEAYRLL
jgi:arginine exporter protein ArgO